MLLVIFGAGASYDSVYHRPPPEAQFSTNVARIQRFGSYEESRPPLANQLFDDRPLFVEIMQTYPACKPLVNLLRGDVRVEQQLARFEEQTKTFPERKRLLQRGPLPASPVPLSSPSVLPTRQDIPVDSCS